MRLFALFCLFAVGFSGEFQFDDYYWIHVPVFDGIMPYMKGRPAQTVLLRAIYSIFGLNPMPYKIVSALLHVGVIDALLRICKRFKRGEWAVWVFAIHPVLVSTVGYVIQSSVMMCALFMAWAFLMYDKKRYIGFVTLTVLAMMSKQVAYVFPCVILLYEWFKRDKPWQIPFLVGVMCFCGLLLSSDLFTISGNRLFTPWERICTQASLTPMYSKMVLLPHISRYTLDHAVVHTSSCLYLCDLTLLVAVGVIYADRWYRFTIMGLACLLAPEFTTMNLELVFEHRLYVPLAFLCVLAPASKPWMRKIAPYLITYLVAVNIQYQQILANQERLWSHTIDIYPWSYRANFNYAKAIHEKDPLKSLAYFNKLKNCLDLKRGLWSNELAEKWALWQPSIDAEIKKCQGFK